MTKVFFTQDWQTNYDSLHLLIGHRFFSFAIWRKKNFYRSDIDPNYEAYPEITEKNIRWLKVILNWKTCLLTIFLCFSFPFQWCCDTSGTGRLNHCNLAKRLTWTWSTGKILKWLLFISGTSLFDWGDPVRANIENTWNKIFTHNKYNLMYLVRAWLACKGDHRKLQHTKYMLQNLQ